MLFRTALYINGNRDNEFPKMMVSLDNDEINEAVSFYNLNEQSRFRNEVRYFNAHNNVSLYMMEIDEHLPSFNDWLSSING